MKKNQLQLDYTKDGFVELLNRADTHPFVLYYDKSNSLYRIFATQEKCDAWV